jgi:hypothetical protein
LEQVKHSFDYDEENKVFFYFVDAVSVENVQYFSTSRSLRKRITQLAGGQWLNYRSYQVDQLLPLARLEKLRLLVSPN